MLSAILSQNQTIEETSHNRKKSITLAKRSINGSEMFAPVAPGSQKFKETDNQVFVSDMTELDGEYVILVKKM
jgi:hypothetical protein